ncbi:MAG: hypothetical protein ABS79_00035 [Planctomycetes bacterium SCN 63-9]|nr:MAG: hypothetical protein ABS79_00035 [Planctomycetes bacterium SCN 63-9]
MPEKRGDIAAGRTPDLSPTGEKEAATSRRRLAGQGPAARIAGELASAFRDRAKKAVVTPEK